MPGCRGDDLDVAGVALCGPEIKRVGYLFIFTPFSLLRRGFF